MLSESQRLNAVVWKAKKQGVSYGTFCTALTEEKYEQIYYEYQKFLKMQGRNRKHAKRKMEFCSK